MALTLNEQERKEVITALIANCGGWGEDDVELLANMSDEKLIGHIGGCAEMAQLTENAAQGDDTGLPDSMKPASAGEVESAEEGADDEQELDGEEGEAGPTKTHPDLKKDIPVRTGKNKKSVTKDEEEAPELSENEYIEQLPPRIRSVVVNALNFELEQKRQLVQRITTNSRNRFNPEFLMDKDLEELQALADLAAPMNQSASPIYTAAAGGAVYNQADVDRDDILTIPTLEFSLANDE